MSCVWFDDYGPHYGRGFQETKWVKVPTPVVKVPEKNTGKTWNIYWKFPWHNATTPVKIDGENEEKAREKARSLCRSVGAIGFTMQEA